MSTKIKDNKPELSVIIITFQSEEYIEACLRTLLDSINKARINSEIILIDNNSKDKTITCLYKFSKELKIIRNKENVGFARAVNIGINISRGKKILLLNPDTVIKRNSIEEIMRCSKNADIVGGKMVGSKNEYRGSCFRKPNLLITIFDFTNLKKIFPNNKWHKSFYYKDYIGKNISRDVDVVSGGYMLINKKVVNDIGLFDEGYFMYLEDVDYCIRAKRSNYRIVYCPRSVIAHESGGSSKNRERANIDAWLESRKYFCSKHFSYISNLIIQILFRVDSLFIKIIMAIR